MMKWYQTGLLLAIGMGLGGCGEHREGGFMAAPTSQGAMKGDEALKRGGGAGPVEGAPVEDEGEEFGEDGTAIPPVAFAGAYLSCGLVDDLATLGCQLSGEVSLEDTVFSAAFAWSTGEVADLLKIATATSARGNGSYQEYFAFDYGEYDGKLVLAIDTEGGRVSYEIAAADIRGAQDLVIDEVAGEVISSSTRKKAAKEKAKSKKYSKDAAAEKAKAASLLNKKYAKKLKNASGG